MMIEQNKLAEYKEVKIVCPVCGAQDKINIPIQIINESKQLTTVSIPTGKICEHTFQFFVDKNFKVRGYQRVDFELSKLEYVEGGKGGCEDQKMVKPGLRAEKLFNPIIDLLRKSVDGRQILGNAIFTEQGKVLYSSLPNNELFNTIKELKVRKEENLTKIKKMFLILENSRKVFSNYITIKNEKFAIIAVFSDRVKIGLGNLLFREILKEIHSLTNAIQNQGKS